MKLLDVTARRLHNERLTGSAFSKPEDVVAWFGAVQAQDYAGAKWAIAQRCRTATDADLDAACDAGRILRTHVLRPTWHFVTPADIRWMLALSAPRVRAASAYYYRKFELDEATFSRSNAAFTRALSGGKELTRTQLGAVLERAGIIAGGERLGLLVMRAELDAVLCSGARRGKQFTYALLDERAPGANSRAFSRDAALSALTLRYFQSHGPAQVHDFAWWSGLTVTDAKRGMELAGAALTSEVVEDKTFFFAPSRKPRPFPSPLVHLLPNFDEYLVAYKDHRVALQIATAKAFGPLAMYFANHIVCLDGQAVGAWRRSVEKRNAVVELNLLVPFDKAQERALEAAADRYSEFCNAPVRLTKRAGSR